jgi:tetratricopeptide (TPR) repeat protein
MRRGPSPHRSPGAVLLRGALWGALLLAALPGCRARAGEPARRRPAADAEWSWLERTEGQLEERRARLAATPDPKLQKETDSLTGELDRRLAAYINADPPVEGEPLTARQQAALRMRSDEEIHLARAYLDQGGDFQRAIDVLQQALAVDPGNPRLQSELARAQARRYMTRQTFAQAQKGMTPDEVRRLLGAPNLNDVRGYPDHNVVGWFYPRDAKGAAAAVWFHREDGKLIVYLTDFDALRPPPAPAAAAPASHGAARPAA